MTVPPERCRRAFEVDLVAFVHDASGPTWADFREHYPLCADCSVEVRTWTELEIVLQGGAPPATTHPTPDDLLRFDDGEGLDADYRRIVEYHVASCRPCADEIATLRAFDFGALDARATPPAFVGHVQVPVDHAAPATAADAEIAEELPTRDDAPDAPIEYAAKPDAEAEAPVLTAAPAAAPETDLDPLAESRPTDAAEPVLDASAGSEPRPSEDLGPPSEAESTTAGVAASEPVPELALEAGVASEPEPVLEAESATEPEPVLEAGVASEPEPVLEAESATEPEPVLEAESATEPEPVLEAESASEPELALEAGVASESEPVLEAESASEPEPLAEAESASEPESVLEAEPASEPEPALEPEPVSDAEPTPTPGPALDAAATIDKAVQTDGGAPVESDLDVVAAAPSEAIPAPALDADVRAVPDLDADPTLVATPEPALDALPEPQAAAAARVPSDGGFLPPEALLEGFEQPDGETGAGSHLAQRGRLAQVARHPAVGVSLVAVLLLPVLWVGELPRFPFGAPARPVAPESHELPEARVAVATVLEPASGLTAEERALEMPSKLSESEVEPVVEASEPKEPTQVALARGDDTLSDAPGVIVPEEAELPADAADPWALARLDDAGPIEIVGESLAAGLELEVPVPLTVPAGAVLQVQISGADAREIVERLSFPGAREVAVRVPAGWLVPGTYEVRVGVVRRGPAPVRVASYALVVH